MSLNLTNKSQEEWLQQGGVQDALDFVGGMVDSLSKQTAGVSFKSVEEDALSDEGSVEEDEATEDISAEDTEDKSVDEKDASEDSEDTQDSSDDEQAETDEDESSEEADTKDVTFATMVQESIVAALKEYHASVVEPMLKELKEVKQAKPETASIFGSFDLVPPIASTIQKEFGVVQDNSEVVGKEADENDEAVVTESETATPENSSLFAGF